MDQYVDQLDGLVPMTSGTYHGRLRVVTLACHGLSRQGTPEAPDEHHAMWKKRHNRFKYRVLGMSYYTTT
jgi:hypothetical protein